MIEIVHARTGADILKKNGRCLASPYDPAREGEAWAERALAAIPKGGGAFALGLGSGYAAASLFKRVDPERLVILEPDGGVVERAREILAQAGGSADRLFAERIACAPTPDEAIDLACAQNVLRMRFAILPFGPSVDADRDWHRRAAALLIAREPWAFRRAVERRPGLAAALDEENLAKLDELASIASVRRLMRTTAQSREAAIWRALGELAR